MDAIEYLTDQHREIESLFDQFETAARMKPKIRLWRKLADLLAVHTAVEERIFFPAADEAVTEDTLLRALDEHLRMESAIADLGRIEHVSPQVVAKMSALRERTMHHAGEEERDLFAKARDVLSREQLALLGRRMEELADQLMDRGPRERLIARIAQA